jgi:hypothetical protein
MSDNTDQKAQQELIKKLLDAGFDTGWALNDLDLVIWEHETEPPKPLTRPK